METIYDKIEEAVNAAKIDGIKYERGYPSDCIHFEKTNDEIIDDENLDTVGPLAQALVVIAKTILQKASIDDDVEVTFRHLPAEESWAIYIGDGR